MRLAVLDGRRDAGGSPLPTLSPILAALADSERHFRTLVEQAADGILVTDAAGRVILANGRMCELLGCTPAEIIGLDLIDTYPPGDREDGRRRLGALAPGATERFERPLLRRDGTLLPVEVSVAWLPNGERQAIVRDVSARKRAEDELRRLAEELELRVAERTHQLATANEELETANAELQGLLREQERLQAELAYRALHDPLTGLANRAMFGERLEHAMRTAERGVALVWIDLDHFKEVNDIFGHEVGDELLAAVAERLRDVVRETDDIARMGGDEFAVILPNVVPPEARMVAERILAALTDHDALRLRVGASLGVAWGRSGSDPLALLRRADQAMYRAKGAGGGVAFTG